jgi:hypothetical protein
VYDLRQMYCRIIIYPLVRRQIYHLAPSRRRVQLLNVLPFTPCDSIYGREQWQKSWLPFNTAYWSPDAILQRAFRGLARLLASRSTMLFSWHCRISQFYRPSAMNKKTMKRCTFSAWPTEDQLRRRAVKCGVIALVMMQLTMRAERHSGGVCQ